jgi:uncharacterized membrane protein
MIHKAVALSNPHKEGYRATPTFLPDLRGSGYPVSIFDEIERMREMNWKSRFRNYGLWVYFASLVFLLLHGVGVEIVDGYYDRVVDFFLGMLVLFGIVNNPTTTHRGYLDDRQK